MSVGTDPLIGTPQCPHLGFEARDSIPCCHADDLTRGNCGKSVPNPKVAKLTDQSANLTAVEAHFCTVLGTDSLPAGAIRADKQEKAKQTLAKRKETSFKAPDRITGRSEAKPSREYDEETGPVIPTHTLQSDQTRVRPNQPCPCGSGKKFKKCCGRY